MAYKKDIRPWLKENGFTWKDMNKIWAEVCEVNWKCRKIAESGKSWSDLMMFQIEKLPTLKEKTLKQLAEKEEKDRLESEQKKKEKEAVEYYSEHFEEIMVQKIDKGELLSESELSELREFSIETSYGENRRWQRTVTDIVELCGRYFSLEWQEGLTESQENDFTEQPFEVFPYETLKISVEKGYSKEKKSDAVTESMFSCEKDGLDMVLSSLKDMVSKGTLRGIKILESDSSVAVMSMMEED